jgi:hypothetical protein
MSDSRSVIDGASPTINTTTASVAFASNGDTSADLSSFVGAFVEVRATAAFRTRGSAAVAACTAGDFPRSADTSYHFKVTPDTRFLNIRGNAAAGTLFYAKASP